MAKQVRYRSQKGTEMRYAKGQKEQSRRHIVAVAGRRFRRDGIDAVGIAGLMEDAGLTHGGFYNHFKSKEELVSEAFAASLDETLDWLEREATRKGGDMAALVTTYLDKRHVERTERGCALAALCSDMARRPKKQRLSIASQLNRFVALVRKFLPSEVKDTDRADAIAKSILATMLGALQMARLSGSDEDSETFLEAATHIILTGLNRESNAPDTNTPPRTSSI